MDECVLGQKRRKGEDLGFILYMVDLHNEAVHYYRNLIGKLTE